MVLYSRGSEHARIVQSGGKCFHRQSPPFVVASACISSCSSFTRIKRKLTERSLDNELREREREHPQIQLRASQEMQKKRKKAKVRCCWISLGALLSLICFFFSSSSSSFGSSHDMGKKQQETRIESVDREGQQQTTFFIAKHPISCKDRYGDQPSSGRRKREREQIPIRSIRKNMMRNIALYTGRRDIVFLLGERTNGAFPREIPREKPKKKEREHQNGRIDR